MLIPIKPKNGKMGLTKMEKRSISSFLKEKNNKNLMLFIGSKKETTDYLIELRGAKLKTIKQNRFYWGVLIKSIKLEIDRLYGGDADSKELSDDILRDLGIKKQYEIFGIKKNRPMKISEMSEEDISKTINIILDNISREHVSKDPVNGSVYGLNFVVIETEEEYSSRVSMGGYTSVDGERLPFIVTSELYNNLNK